MYYSECFMRCMILDANTLLSLSFCLKGWECIAGCNTENGFCERGKCRCKPGWQGDNCNQCVTFPGCVHGTCEKAWQCICREGWVGSLCDQDTRLCSSRPCADNATCIETGEGGYLCICPYGHAGENCHLKRGVCLTNSSPCQNGGTCMDASGSAGYSSCLCTPGFSGDLCEISIDSCQPNPCLNGGNCTNHGLAFMCVCPHGFTGPTCSLPPERDLLKITLKETVHSPGVLVTHGQLICFGLLALLTCLIILGTAGIVFFGRCEAWLANAKYSQLVRLQKEHLLREAGSTSQEKPEHSVNIILPEKIRLTSFGRHYTSI
uniref:Protein delta homolog 1 n=1 Tax=Mastacembelus armatus TaxID=205130 RepID=A0A3Q3LC58_9TELE